MAGLLMAYWGGPKPELKTFTVYSTAYTDKDGQLLRLSLAQDQRYRLYTPLQDISDKFIRATVMYEDQHYFQHGGVDVIALVRAFWATYISQQRRIGASTITMQVARLRWQIASNTVMGKVEQIFRAIQLTRHYTKQEVLESYLNLAPYGRNIEGIGAASLIYFNKKPHQLNLLEALTLAVVPQNPNRRTPDSAQGFATLSTARGNLFSRWLLSYPADAGQGKYFNLPLRVRGPEKLPFLAPHFVDYMAQQQSRWDSGYVTTTLDGLKQKHLEAIVTDYIATKSNLGISNAAVLLLNYKTMQIESMLGSADFLDHEISGQVNGVLAKRSPGSALKPFVYGLAMDEGLIHPMTLLRDSPARFGGFTPENYDKKFSGPILARDALIESRNVPAVQLQSQLRKQRFYGFLKRAGVTGLKQESHYGLALALGGGEVSMLELAQLYAMLANQGGFEKASGRVDDSEKKGTLSRLLSPEASYLVLNILKDNPAPDQIDFQRGSASHGQGLVLEDKGLVGEGRGRAGRSNDVAWKTGTSWAFRDAWAVGVSGDYVVAVWVGNFDGSGNDAFVGRTAAGPLLFAIVDALVPKAGWSAELDLWTPGLNVKQVAMCRHTGDLPGKHCPSTELSPFIPGVSPIKVSDVYRAVPVLNDTGERACEFDAAISTMKVYEFWRSDFQRIFRQAGISLKTPPAYSKDCSLDQKSRSGLLPVIRSPQTRLAYALQRGNGETVKVPLAAVVDPDVKKLFWFINDRFVGSSEPSHPFFWPAESGNHSVRVVDDSGRSASAYFKAFNIN